MAIEGKQSPGTLSGIGQPRRSATPLPESCEQPVGATPSYAEELAEKEKRQRLSTVPPPSRRPRSATVDFPGRGERQAFRGASEPPAYARRLSARPSGAPRDSAGFYSMRDEKLEDVRIPKAPRLPQLDLESIDLEPVGKSGSFNRDTLPPSAGATIRTPAPSRTRFSEERSTEGRPTEAPSSGASKTLRSTIPPPSRSKVQNRSPDLPSVTEPAPSRESETSPRIYFSPHVRRQANDWAETGSLSIPGCSSPRHARALQRALLLALLTEPGWHALPQGLQQRAGWLFCEGWESSAAEGRSFREIDDLATVLGLEASVATRVTLARSVASQIPLGAQSRRASELPPSNRGRASQR